MSHRLITLHSTERNGALSSNSSNCSIKLGQALPLHHKNVKRLHLRQFVFPNTIYTFSDQLIDYNDGSVRQATITAGYYSAASLATEIGTQMTASGGQTYTAAVSATTNKITISAAGAFSLLWSSGAGVASTQILWKLLGFSGTAGTVAADSASATSHTGTDIVDVSLPRSIYVNLKLNSITDLPNIYMAYNGHWFTYEIPLRAPFGELESYSTSNDFDQWVEIPRDLNVIRQVDICLYDENYSTVSLNGSEWSMLLELQE